MCQMVSVKTNFNTEIQVADIKKDVIENIIEAAGTCTRICQIILFGSVLESRCQEDSDIDMLVVSVAEHHPAFDGVPVFLLSEQSVIPLEGKPDGTSYLQEYMELLDKGKPESWWTTELRGIVQEEAGTFFAGDRSASAAAEILQFIICLKL